MEKITAGAGIQHEENMISTNALILFKLILRSAPFKRFLGFLFHQGPPVAPPAVSRDRGQETNSGVKPLNNDYTPMWGSSH